LPKLQEEYPCKTRTHPPAQRRRRKQTGSDVEFKLTPAPKYALNRTVKWVSRSRNQLGTRPDRNVRL
jgi:hypothetical protein